MVYLIKAVSHTGDVTYKIGVTSRPIAYRLKELKTSNPADLQLMASFESRFAYKLESILHRRYRRNGISGEWFDGSVDPADFLIVAANSEAALQAITDMKI